MSFSALPPRKKRNVAHASSRTMEARGSMQQHSRELSEIKRFVSGGTVLEISTYITTYGDISLNQEYRVPQTLTKGKRV